MEAYTELLRHSGNQTLFQVVEMSVLAVWVDRPLHIHAEGLRGTGKTTILRAARNLLPLIRRVRGCPYNCHPFYPHCPDHVGLTRGKILDIGFEDIPMPFLEISHASKIGTITGSVNLAKSTDPNRPTAVIRPGIIPQAHRGIVFVDGINRLVDTAPDLSSVLLDVMATKPSRVQIETRGLPTVQIPVQVSIWATSNSDEDLGPLEHVHRQLSDRFDMVARMGHLTERDGMHNILRQSQTYRDNPRRIIYGDAVEATGEYQQRFHVLSRAFEQIRMSDDIKNTIASIYLDFGLESLRPVEGMELGCRIHAALQNRRRVLIEDLIAVVPFVLAHRVNLTTLRDVLQYLDYVHFNHSKPALSPTLESRLSP